MIVDNILDMMADLVGILTAFEDDVIVILNDAYGKLVDLEMLLEPKEEL